MGQLLLGILIGVVLLFFLYFLEYPIEYLLDVVLEDSVLDYYFISFINFIVIIFIISLGVSLVEKKGDSTFNVIKRRKELGYVIIFTALMRLYSFDLPNIHGLGDVFNSILCKLPEFVIFFVSGYCFARISSIDAKYIFEDWKEEKEKEGAKKLATTTTPSKSRKYTVEITRNKS